MDAKRTVYAVSTGSYSNYTIEAVFEDRVDAEMTAERVGGTVEEFEILPPGSGGYIRPRLRYVVNTTVSCHGKINTEWSEHSSYVDQDSAPEPPLMHTDYYGHYRIMVQADTREAAVKAASEYAARVGALVVEGVDPMSGKDAVELD